MTAVGLVEGRSRFSRRSRWRWRRCRRCCRCRTPMRCRGSARAAAPTARCGCGARSPSSPATSARALMLEAIAPGHLIWLIVFALMLVVAAAAALEPVEAGARPAGGRATASRRSYCCAIRRFSRWRWRRAMIQSSHALYYGFSTAGMARRGPRRHGDRRAVGPRRRGRDRAVCAVRAAAGKSLRPDRAAGDRRRGRDRALGRDGVRSAGGAAAAAAAPARRLVRRRRISG